MPVPVVAKSTIFVCSSTELLGSNPDRGITVSVECVVTSRYALRWTRLKGWKLKQ